MKFKKLKVFTLFCFTLALFGQELPKDFYDYKLENVYFDLGENWIDRTTFGPVRINHKNTMSDSLKINSRFGFNFFSDQDKTKVLYTYNTFTFNSNFHGYLFARIVNNPQFFSDYSGIPREISRIGFNSGETDASGISYESDWMILQFGRGRQSWGAGNDIQILLSNSSNSYDYGMMDLDFGRLKVRYFHGFLETDSLRTSRYLTGRGIEWNNNKNFLFSLSEVIVYSGENRAIDLAYSNPISTHLEVELNDRQSEIGADNGNGAWQISFDFFHKKNVRFSANYLFDEFVLDREQKREGKSHGDAYSLKLVSSPASLNSLVSFYCSIIKIGSNTFRHEDGNNNFIHRGNTLGSIYGSDFIDYRIGLRTVLLSKKFLGNLGVGRRLNGENNIINSPYTPYTDYSSGEFPSGNVNTIHYFDCEFQYWYKTNLSFICNTEYSQSESSENHLKLFFGLDFYLPLNFQL